jgi:hypothetical protein
MVSNGTRLVVLPLTPSLELIMQDNQVIEDGLYCLGWKASQSETASSTS